MRLHRRTFLTNSARGIAMMLAPRSFDAQSKTASQTQAVRIKVKNRQKLNQIPSDFTGLGFEISSVAIPGLLSSQNRTYVQLLRNLGGRGVIRIGGNTSDYSFYTPNARAVSSPEKTVVNAAALRELRTFLDATGWQLIWGLNLGRADQQQAVDESQAVAAALNEKLLAFEIGNEPDLFGHHAAHRPDGYGYDDYAAEYRRFKAAVRATLPAAQFAGPDVASATDWVTRFADSEGRDLKLLTHHYYRECANPESTLAKLLHSDPKLTPILDKLRSASRTSHLPYRICETNSFCGGGKPGVSDTFGAALWILDFMFLLASADCSGVNIETGVNQLGFVSSYSPIVEGSGGAYTAKPAYYGMLAFGHASRGRLVELDCEAADLNLTAYAVVGDRNGLTITIINKDASRDADVSIYASREVSTGRAIRLRAPSMRSEDAVTLAGAAVNGVGEWKPKLFEPVRRKGDLYKIRVPGASAAIVKW